ncbi:hypothetical protein TSOC_013680 [Tetrabaena socialis]|uniref:Uncharacterized protein n=1 Tax=Tetrabaena socialis TaxID=47790 RepID=A0A2J7ZJQ7_9CHLO|nr:hypothetical protein TSOC_013680 [Tetrabaena socialis]|eukprot:PNH00493.1 hypothetical protein TSOC_013680 [Tetrabaena socialis]
MRCVAAAAGPPAPGAAAGSPAGSAAAASQAAVSPPGPAAVAAPAAASLQSPGAGAAASLPWSPQSITWVDGDVARLLLADGRRVYAEVEAERQQQQQQPRQQRQQQPQPRRSQQRAAPPPSAAASPSAAAAAYGGSGRAKSDGPLLLLCCGARYTLAANDAATAPAVTAASAAVAAAGSTQSAATGLAWEEAVGARKEWVLAAIAGALAPGDPLFSMPPKQHSAALRAWAPLVTPLLRPPQLPPPQEQQGQAHGQQQGQGQGQGQQQGQGQAQAQAQAQQQGQQAFVSAGAPLDGCVVVGVERVASLAGLRGAAEAEPGLWCDGTGPGDPPLTEDESALYTAGELACLLSGRRCVVLLQLHVGWQQPAATPPYGPYKPLVLRLLREALTERSDIVSFISLAGAASGGGGSGVAAAAVPYGLTLVLCADREPFRSWGAHLASFGCQSALEAQSPYYKFLVGRVLGYRPLNIAHHIQANHGQPPAPEVVAAVEQELLRLSTKQPSLPWTAGARGGGRKKAK